MSIKFAPINAHIMGVRIAPYERTILREKDRTCPGIARRHFVASVVRCAKMAEPIEMPFGLWTRVGPRIGSTYGYAGVHWRNLANTI